MCHYKRKSNFNQELEKTKGPLFFLEKLCLIKSVLIISTLVIFTYKTRSMWKLFFSEWVSAAYTHINLSKCNSLPFFHWLEMLYFFVDWTSCTFQHYFLTLVHTFDLYFLMTVINCGNYSSFLLLMSEIILLHNIFLKYCFLACLLYLFYHINLSYFIK